MIALRALTIPLALGLCIACGSKKSDDDGKKPIKKAPSADTLAPKGMKAPIAMPPKGDPVADAHDDTKTKEVELLAADKYEAMMMALKACAIDGMSISNGCPAARALGLARRSSKLGPAVANLAEKHIDHPSEQVRIHAAAMMRSLVTPKDSHVAAALKVVGDEESPAVLAQLVRALRPAMQSKPDVAKLMLKLSEHESALVRGEVGEALVSTFAANTEGTMQRAIEMVENDDNMDVRVRTCRDLGRRVDDDALPALKRLTQEKLAAKAPKLYSACWNSLAHMVVSYPFFDRSSEEAYDQFMAHFATVKCTKATPPWGVMNLLAHFTSDKLVAIAPWTKAKRGEVQTALLRVANCKDANWLSRAGAVDALKKTGAPAKTFKTLIAGLKKSKDDTSAAKLVTKIESLR